MASKRFNGIIKLDVRDSTEDWGPYRAPQVDQTKWRLHSPPNILFVLYDDTGLAAWSPYGGGIHMPTLDAIAAKGLIYTQWHTAALCSPTRGMLLTGRNHHLNGNASITEGANGFPGQHARLPDECATVAQILRDNGWSTFWVGKNHNVPETDVAQGGSKSQWPLAKGFDRFYGFIGGETNQWYPDIIVDNHPEELPEDHTDGFEHEAEGYHLSKDLADNAIQMIKDQQASNPSKPWYMWFCPGANHAPHHAPKEYINKYWHQTPKSQGEGERSFDFRLGYGVYRQWVAGRMVERGILPSGTDPTALNPMINPEGATNTYVENPADRVIPWHRIGAEDPWGSDPLTLIEEHRRDQQQQVFAKLMAVYAAFSEYTDFQVGRIVEYLKATNQYENTVIIYAADNGASGEGSPTGSVNENKFFNDYPEDPKQNYDNLDKFGGPDTYEHFPTGWAVATSTPFKMFKRYSQYAGGTCDPLVISWPRGIQVDESNPLNNVRHQYHHATDIVPTILDICKLEMPEYYKGTFQYPLSGVSMTYTFPQEAKAAPTQKKRQYYAMLGTRAMWEEGWKAVALHAPLSGGGKFDEDTWQLYYVDVNRPAPPTNDDELNLEWVNPDPSESTNLVSESYLAELAKGPEGKERVQFLKIKVQHLINLWFEEAGKNLVLPLDDRSAAQQLGVKRPTDEPEDKPFYTYYPFAAPVPEAVAPNLRGRSYKLEATVVVDNSSRGVIFAHGSRFGGHTVFIEAPATEGGQPVVYYEYNFLGIERQQLSLPVTTSGELKITVEFIKDRVENNNTCYGTTTLKLEPVGGTAATTNGEMRTQMGKFTLSGDGLCVGYDSADSISDRYHGANRFQGGEIKAVVITPDYTDVAKVSERIASGAYSAD